VRVFAAGRVDLFVFCGVVSPSLLLLAQPCRHDDFRIEAARLAGQVARTVRRNPCARGYPFPTTRPTSRGTLTPSAHAGLRLEHKTAKKARRIAYHVVRASKKFILGSGNAAWVMGTSLLVMVMPLAFQIEREQQGGVEAWDAGVGAQK